MSIADRYRAYQASCRAHDEWMATSGREDGHGQPPQRTTWSVRPEWGQTADDED